MASSFLSGLHGFQIAFGAYNTYLSSTVWLKLNSYDVVSKQSSQASEIAGVHEEKAAPITGGIAVSLM